MSNNYSVKNPCEIAEDALIGEGTKIWAFSKVLKGSKVGSNCIIGSFVEIGPHAVVGDECKIQNGVYIYKGITLERRVFCGPNATFTNVRNPRAHVERKDEYTEILVKEGATIGANSTIIGNPDSVRVIGKYSFIAAGAIVTRDVEDYALFQGQPARHRGWVCECGEIVSRNTESLGESLVECRRCRSKYMHRGKTFSKCP
jgi:UDP-2-acetamido-3-amino-2,3-dideoxy-glucuronate N-acetyltransferase